MKILYLSYSRNSLYENYVNTITMNIIKGLLNRKHIIDFYSNKYSKNISKLPLNIVKNKNIKNNIYDIVIIQNSVVFNKYKYILSLFSNIPHIFISYSEQIMDNPIINNNIYAIIKLFHKYCLYDKHYVNEYSKILTSPFFYEKYINDINKKYERKNNYDILFIPPLTDNILYTYNLIINAFNNQNCINVSIWGDEFKYILEGYCNRNIKFITSKNSLKSHIEKNDIIIGSNYGIIESINIGKPYIIFGKRGFGGIINKNNFEKMMKNDFEGRIGGEIYEFTNIKMLYNEIEYILSNPEEIREILKDNMNIIKNNYNYQKIIMEFENIFKKAIDLNSKLNDDNKIVKLKPILLKNIEYILNDNKYKSFKLTNMMTKKELFLIPGELIELTNKMNGNLSILEILKESGYYSKDNLRWFIEIILQLWYVKAISFNENI
jgi:hypothetical protein